MDSTAKPPRRPRRPGSAQQRVDAIYEDLRYRISHLHYPPGTQLSETQLAEEYGVSRTPIRRVLQRLESERLAERTQGTHTVVTTFDLESLRDVYLLRMVLVENMDQLSPRPPTRHDAGKLEALLERAKRVAKQPDLDELARIHVTYQEQLNDVIGNEAAREVLQRLYYQTARIWLYLLPLMHWEEEVGALCDEITDILMAMRAGDMRTVGLVRRNHISMNLIRMSRLSKEQALTRLGLHEEART